LAGEKSAYFIWSVMLVANNVGKKSTPGPTALAEKSRHDFFLLRFVETKPIFPGKCGQNYKQTLFLFSS